MGPIVSRNQAGTAFGFNNLVGNFGGIVGPIIVGAAGESNLINGFYILGFALVLGFLLAVFVTGRFHVPQEVESTAKRIQEQ